MENFSDPEITGSHEEFWTFSQVSQWGSHWGYTSPQNEQLKSVLSHVFKARQIGLKRKFAPRLVHFAQLLIWRFYLKESLTEYPIQQIMPLAYECSAQILEIDSPKNSVIEEIGAFNNPRARNVSDFKAHFNFVTSLEYNIRLHHPSDYLNRFINPTFSEKEKKLANAIISDSFMVPVCLVHKPSIIAEGAAIMAAAMLNNIGSVKPKTSKSLSFITDMNGFYKQKTQKA